MTASPDELEQAIRLAEKQEPTPDEAAFLKQFFTVQLQPRPGEDPAAHAARLSTPELFMLYRRLRSDVDFSLPEARPAAPTAAPVHDHESVAARLLSERVPAATCHADFVDVDEEYAPAGSYGVTREDEPTTPEHPAAPGERSHATPMNKRVSRLQRVRNAVANFAHRYKLAVRASVAAIAIAASSYGMMYVINRQAHRSAEPIRQRQQQTGQTADDISRDPSGVPINNGVRPTSAVTETSSR